MDKTFLTRLLSITAAFIVAFTVSTPAQAVTIWSATGPGTVTVLQDGSGGVSEMTYSLSGSEVFSTQTWTFLTTAASSGPVTYDWAYDGFHAFFQVRVFLIADNGVDQTLVNDGPVNCCTPPSGGFNYSGQYTFNVLAGESYGFRFGGSNFDSNSVLQGHFTAAAVPEPATLTLLLIGGAAAGLIRLRKRQGP